MSAAPLPDREPGRLEALRRYRVLDSPPEPIYDDLVRLAAKICEMPIALISLVDRDRQWFKARFGLDLAQTPRADAFCAYTILQSTPLVVPDALADGRFCESPLVTGTLRFRSYAGMPLLTPDGYALGTLCVVDCRPRRLDPEQLFALETLGRLAFTQLELRRTAGGLGPREPLPICSACKNVRDDEGFWWRIEEFLRDRSVAVSDRICPECLRQHLPHFAQNSD